MANRSSVGSKLNGIWVMKHVGYLMFGLGIAIAVCGAAKLPALRPDTQPEPESAATATDRVDATRSAAHSEEADFLSRFPDTMGVFVGGALLAVLGLVLWRLGLRAETAEAANIGTVDQPDDPIALLRSLQQPARKLAAEIGSLDSDRLLERLDELNERFVLPFAEARMRVIDRKGMSVGADILATAAVGERMLNRTWSAAADGHLQEARSSYDEAVEAFTAAIRLLDA